MARLRKNKRRGLVLLLTLISILLFVFIQNLKQENLRKSYKRQNYAFNILGDFSLVIEDDNSALDPDQYYGFNEVRSENKLYAWLAFYNHETNSDLQVQDIEQYLSTEYEENGEVRKSENYPEIQAYIDFIWERAELESDHPDSLSRFNVYLSSSFNPYYLEQGIPFNETDKETLDKVREEALESKERNN